MKFSETQIDLLSRSMKGDKNAYQLLLAESRDLAAAGAALLGDVNSMNWLLKNNKVLALFVDASDGNKSAVKVLLIKKYFRFAAVANFLNGDDAAGEWLAKYHLKHYLTLAENIKYAREKASEFDMGAYFRLFD